MSVALFLYLVMWFYVWQLIIFVIQNAFAIRIFTVVVKILTLTGNQILRIARFKTPFALYQSHRELDIGREVMSRRETFNLYLSTY